jgi:2OG-Fe(II) oxygenase superfamily
MSRERKDFGFFTSHFDAAHHMEPDSNKKQRLFISDARTIVNKHVEVDSIPAASLQPQKRYSTRAVANSGLSSSSRKSHAPIRIRPPSFNLHFRRMHDLFFSNDDQTDDAEHQDDELSATRTPRIVKIGSIRLQSIFKSPNIFVINEFLSPSDVKYFFAHFISKYKFQRSYVDDSGELIPDDSDTTERLTNKPFVNPYRTSTFISLNKQHNSRIARLEEKVASLFGCSTKQIEALQLVRYQSPNQCFHVHHDLGVYNEVTGQVELPNKSIWYQRRIVTIFCYLNTVPPSCGGATYFPRCTSRDVQNLQFSESQSYSERVPTAVVGESFDQVGSDDSIVCKADGLRIYPMAGRAVVFSNVLASGDPDPRTIHAGEPVSTPPNEAADYHGDNKGTKYGLNIWICES